LFNALTGLRAKVANYAGVTVERKEGRLIGAPPELNARVLDLPGTYSLSAQSLDEQISRDVLLNRLPELSKPALIIVVVDASNLQRNLYYATQVLELGHPTMVALNMMDVARDNGHQIDTSKLATALGAPVGPIVASTGEGLPELRRSIVRLVEVSSQPSPRRFVDLPIPLEQEVNDLSQRLLQYGDTESESAFAEALLLLSSEGGQIPANAETPDLGALLIEARHRLDAQSVDWRTASIEGRYSRISAIQEAVTVETRVPGETFSDRLDRVLTHKLWGSIIFLTAMALMFQSIFTIARIPMDALQSGIDWFGGAVGRSMPPGDLNSLLVDGVIAGVGAVVVFLPQILLLFLFIGFLEDTGYMARAAFLMDRLMSKVGLHGKSFIPMLSSFACAIPGIMATRTIESPKDRLVTILVAPLMSCSARLPVYTLLIAACVPNIKVFGFLRLQGLTMLSMYLLGATVALILAWLFKRTLLKGEPPLLILELPPYKRPPLSLVLRHMWDRAKLFLKNAGTIILAMNIFLWFLASYPRLPQEHSPTGQTRTVQHADDATKSTQLRHSFAGYLGKGIEPVITPLGFDWKIGIGIISSFAAREVFVSTMSTVYNVENGSSSGDDPTGLVETLRTQKRPDGSLLYTPLTAVALMVFYVFALQCVSTVAIVKRETNSWRWPLFQWLYMGALAWVFAFVVYQGGHLLGFQ
jgi:ferrous iron transport protein B